MNGPTRSAPPPNTRLSSPLASQPRPALNPERLTAVPQEEGIARLLRAKQAYPSRLIGAFGRDWPQEEAPRYIKAPVRPGPARIVLTILML